MPIRLIRLFVLGLLALPLMTAPAEAQFRVCNKTAAPISVALAFETSQDVVSQGWWTIDPDNCTALINTALDKQYFYHYVISNALKFEWKGNYEFCTSDDPQFRITGSQDCEGRTYITKGFRQTDVGSNTDYTLNVRTGPAPATVVDPNAAPAAPPAANPATPPAAAPAQPTSPTSAPAQ